MRSDFECYIYGRKIQITSNTISSDSIRAESLTLSYLQLILSLSIRENDKRSFYLLNIILNKYQNRGLATFYTKSIPILDDLKLSRTNLNLKILRGKRSSVSYFCFIIVINNK